MSKAVLISIRPKWCELIASGAKSIEVRKTRPKLETPFKCYIYETRGFERVGNDSMNCVVGGNGRGKVIGEFVCDRIFPIEPLKKKPPNLGGKRIEEYSKLGYRDCLTDEDFAKYVGLHNGKTMCGWHISNLVIYDEPMKLCEFYRWYDGTTDLRPCENGKPCDHLIFDYSEDHEACGIDYDGENCPFLKVTRPPQSYCYVEELP
jgi:predicted transcriptional regulator